MKPVSETLWRWQYKLCHPRSSGEKTLDDFSSIEQPDPTNIKKPVEPKTPKPASKYAALGSASKNPSIGSNPCIKTLYEGPNSVIDGIFDWVDYPPRQLSKNAAQAQDRTAIMAYKIKDKSKPVISGRYSLMYHRIDLRNPLLIAAVTDVFKEKDLPMEVSEVVTFEQPFRSLYYAYDDFVAKHGALDNDDPLSPFLLLFIKLLDEIFAPTRVKLAHLKSERLISFDLAWAFFPKDTLVVSWGGNCNQLCKVVDTAYTGGLTPSLTINGKILRFNGEAFVWDDMSLDIDRFVGHKPITELDHYPLDYYEDAESLKTRFIARGKKVLDYQGTTYCDYQGLAIHSQGGMLQRHNVNGRILIDVVGYNKHFLNSTPRETTAPNPKRKVVPGPAVWKRLDQESQDKNKKEMLDKEEDLMFMSPLLEGYALTNKLWFSFFVEDIGPIVWNEDAYDHLVYDEEQKDLVLSFVESHDVTQSQPKDVIMGKGQGLIVLLSGPPGTGKTLTAEAIADRTRRPLFYLQAEDLGVAAPSLATKLKKILEMATEWNAVILLDEADVFMAERHPQDIARNELVSIFLRELEYFRGIIFLTTNLYSTIDSAFRSRVSLHLLFKPLTPDARMVVWRKFLNRVPPPVAKPTTGAEGDVPTTMTATKKEQVEGGGAGDSKAKGMASVDEDDIKELSAWNLNGREIKTAVKMVKTWCDYKGHEMTLSRLENGIKATSPHSSKLTHEGDVSIYDH